MSNNWQIVRPIEQAPWITGCKDTHVRAENQRGEQYFVPREWVKARGDAPSSKGLMDG